MGFRRIWTCDICGYECDNNQLHWESRTVELKVNMPIDGTNGGDFSGDWCAACRREVNQCITNLMTKARVTN